MKITTTVIAAMVFVCLVNLTIATAAFSDDSAVKKLPSWVLKGETPDFSAMQRAMEQHPVGNQAFSTGTSSTMAPQIQRSTGKSLSSAKVQNYGSTNDPGGSVRQLFERYKSLDLTNSTQIMNLYAENAQIDVMGAKYNKTSYGRYIAAAYNNPASSINTHTRYGEPNIRVTNDSAQVSFAGALGPSTMNVYWTLRRNPSGVWQIASEQFTAR